MYKQDELLLKMAECISELKWCIDPNNTNYKAFKELNDLRKEIIEVTNEDNKPINDEK